MTIPEAVEISRKHLLELIPELQQTEVQLEELDVPPHSDKWRFTFSAMPVLPAESSWGKIMRATRISKSVEIDSTSGDLLSMKNAAA